MENLSIDFFTQLPHDVHLDILTQLPTESLVQLRCVSKFFNLIISDPNFLNLHLSSTTLSPNHSHHLLYYESIDYTKIYFSFFNSHNFSLCKEFETPFMSLNGFLRLVGSVNGVVCLFDTNYFTYVGTLILWNPFIGKFKIVPPFHGFSSLGEDYSHMVVGFGFDQIKVDFKFVIILYHLKNERGFDPETLVYDVKNESWRRIGSVTPCFMPKRWCSSVFVNGIVHWLAYKTPELHFHRQPNCIMGFDVVCEVFKMIELPMNLEARIIDLLLSTSIDEKSVSLFISSVTDIGEVWGVWSMNEYGKVESWVKIYNVVLDHESIPLKIVSDGQILAAKDKKQLVLIDVEKENFNDLAVRGLPLTFYVTAYKPSLVLLDIGQQLPDFPNRRETGERSA